MPPIPGAVRVAVILGIVALAACHPAPDGLDRDGDGVTRITCMGDSNSVKRPGSGWCELLGQAPRRATWNHSVAGMSIVDFGKTSGGFALSAAPHLDEWMALGPPDVVILAFGSDDLKQRATPQAIVDAYAQAKTRIERSGARCLVALTPPVYPPQPSSRNELIRDLNARLRAAFPTDIVDFWSGMTAADFGPDGIHVSDAGRAKRAAAAREALGL